ncbi:MAG: hypothetical protein Q9160_003616 [Pyrenula sp. 1 TL-2023]
MTGIAAGDLYIELPPEVKETLLKHAKGACGLPAKKRWFEKRQSSSACPAISDAASRNRVIGDYANAVAEDDSILLSPFEHVPTLTAGDIQVAVAALTGAGLPAAGVTAAIQAKAAISVVFLDIWLNSGTMPQQIKVKKESQKAGATYPTKTPTETPTSTQAGCTYTGKGKDQPRCANKTNCDGDDKKICQKGEFKRCKCAGDGQTICQTAGPVKDYTDRYNKAQEVLKKIDDTVHQAAEHPWCVHECSQSSNPRCICRCGDGTYSEAAKITPIVLPSPKDSKPSPTPADPVANFWQQPCPYISGDPNMSKISAIQKPADITKIVRPSSFPNYKPAASSEAASALRISDNGQNFVRDTALKAAKARCKQLKSEKKKRKPGDDWPGQCAVPNTGAHYSEPGSRNRPATGGACISNYDESDILFQMKLNEENDLYRNAGYGKLTFEEDECNSAFASIIDGLPDFNDLSRKHGGEYFSTGCWIYMILPKYHCKDYKPCPEVKEDHCDIGWGTTCNPGPVLPPM